MKHTCRLLSILFWKNLCERRQRICRTIWEIMSGALIFCMIFLVRQFILSEEMLNEENSGIYNVFYAPQVSWTDSLMEYFAKKILQLQKIIMRGKTFQGFYNSGAIVDYLKHTVDALPTAVILFENVTNWPRNLKYQIYLTQHQNLSSVDARIGQYLLHRASLGVTDEDVPIMTKLQWLLDKSFMELSNVGNYNNVTDDFDTVRMIINIDRNLETIYHFLIVCTVLAPMPFFLYTSARLVEEKQTGLKEMMKLVGVSPTVLRFSHLLDSLLIGTIYSIIVTILLKITSSPILPYSNSIIIAFTIIFHFLNITSFAFITSTICQDYQHSDGVSLLIYLMTFIIDNIWYSNVTEELPHIYWLSWLLPHAPIYLFWNEVISLEKIGVGATFTTIWSKHSKINVPIVLTWFFLVVHLCMILTLAWYLELVRPGRYGVANNWKFIFTRKYWRQHKIKKKKKVAFHVTAEHADQLVRDDRYFEKAADDDEIAIKTVNIGKVFLQGKRQVEALKHVNLDVPRGEITVLLGANGAGKTTLLSIITGMYSASTGLVYIDGVDTTTRLQEISKDLSLCPQHNLTFNYLTVSENIMFFEMLKGSTRSEAMDNCTKLMKDLMMDEKKHFFSHQLSAGRRRCLQIACALAGGAEMLVLDEPTSGMDNLTKHSLWDILLLLRGNRTVLISTTCMEEADALGNRIAILHEGRLLCCGTPLFLKQAIDAGFTLTLLFKRKARVDMISGYFKDMPEAKMKVVDKKRITFALPLSSVADFPRIFDRLEEMRQELGIISMTTSMSMEEVFLKFIQRDDIMEATLITSEQSLSGHYLTGCKLWMQQYKNLIMRNVQFISTKKLQFLIMVLVPILGLMFVTLMSNTNLGSKHSLAQNNLGLLRDDAKEIRLDTVVYNLGDFNGFDLTPFANSYPEINFVFAQDVVKEFNKLAKSSSQQECLSLVGMEITKQRARVYYPDKADELAPLAVNLLSNMVMKLVPSRAELSTSVVSMKDDVLEFKVTAKVMEPKQKVLCYGWILYVTFVIILPLAPCIWVSVQELHHGTRYGHIVAGCPAYLHWLSKFTTDMVVYLAVVPPTVLLCCLLLDYDSTLNQGAYLNALFISLVLYGAAFLTSMYVFSFVLSPTNATGYVYILALSIGIILRIFTDLIESYGDVLGAVFILCPTYVFTTLFAEITWTARYNSMCELNRHLCPNFVMADEYFSTDLCCNNQAGSPVYNYYWGQNSTMTYILLLIVHIIAYSTVLMLLQNRKLNNWLDRLINIRYRPPKRIHEDKLVNEETEYVQQSIEQKEQNNVLLAYNLHKNYSGWLHGTERCNAVKGISISVKKGECLAIFGAAGAGKTTTLNIIAGYTAKTRGTIFANGYFLDKNRNEYLHSISFARQSGGLDDFLSGYDNLTLLAKLHGYTPAAANHQAIFWVNYMGLTSHGGAEVGLYSEGCSRRLATAAALLTSPRVALLDEPIESVDAATRPLVSRAMRRVLERGVAVVVATQSMGWRDIETLCNRIAILSGGELAALGTEQQIRESYATGYTAKIKLRVDNVAKMADQDLAKRAQPGKSTSSESLSHSQRVDRLKDAFGHSFEESILIEEHLSILYYHINDSEERIGKILYSELFQRLERLRQDHLDIVENYSLAETSIDEVLTDFARRSGRFSTFRIN